MTFGEHAPLQHPLAVPPARELSVAKALLAIVSAFIVAQIAGSLALLGAAAVLVLRGEVPLRALTQEPALRALMLRPFVVGASLLATQAGLALAAVAFAKIGRLRFLDAVGLGASARPVRPGEVALAMLLVLAAGPVADAVASGVARAFPGFTLGTIDMIGAAVRGDALTAILIGLLVVLAPSFAEEVVFRGLALRAFTARLGPAVGIGLSSLLFGLIHVDPPQASGAAVIGVALGFVTHRTGSLVPAMAAHAANNAAALLFARFADPTPLAEHHVAWWELVISLALTAGVVAGVVRATRAPREPATG